MKKLIVMFTLVAVIMIAPTMVMATTIGNGEGWITGSWAQQMYENGWYSMTVPGGLQRFTYDKFEQFMVSGPAFENPGMDSFSGGTNWSAINVNPYYVVASGNPLLGDLYWTYHFSGAQSTSFVIESLLWSGTSVVGAQRSTWNGSGWAFVEFAYLPGSDQYNRTPVPEPATMLLLGLGLLGVAGIRRFKK